MNITPEQIDTLKELVNIGVGRAANMLNQLVQSRIYLQVPSIKVFHLSKAEEELKGFGKDILATVQIPFKGVFSGKAALVFPAESASNLVSILTDEEIGNPDFDSVRAGTLNEVGNIVISGVMGSLGNMFKERIIYSFPRYVEDTVESIINAEEFNADVYILLAQTHFRIREYEVEGDIVLLFELDAFEALLAALKTVNMELEPEE